MVRDKPDSSLLDVRNEAFLWEMEENRSHRTRVVDVPLNSLSKRLCHVLDHNHGIHQVANQSVLSVEVWVTLLESVPR